MMNTQDMQDAFPVPDLADTAPQAAAHRFTHELDTYFSVLAAAGTGKTWAIVQRTLRLFLHTVQQGRAPAQIVVVTYTQKAAEQMRARARSSLVELGHAQLLPLFEEVFFGTIHSFCLQSLRQAAGLYPDFAWAARAQVIACDDELWARFMDQDSSLGLQAQPGLGAATDPNPLCRYVSAAQVYAVARALGPQTGSVPTVPDHPPGWPQTALEAILAFPGDQLSVRAAKASLQQYLRRLSQGHRQVPLPHCTKGGKAFLECWQQALQPVWDWVSQATYAQAAQVAQAYHQYKIGQGLLTYDDILWHMAALATKPAFAQACAQAAYRVILDEAQDTDALQFAILLTLAGGPQLSGYAMQGGEAFTQALARPQAWAVASTPAQCRLCMVGDAQQAIYGSRTGYQVYQRVHEALTHSGTLVPLTLGYTRRLGTGIAQAVSQLLQPVLSGPPKDQALFIPLTCPPGAHASVACQYTLPQPWDQGAVPPSTSALELLQTQWLYDYLARSAPGEASRHTVAVLAPRKAWLQPLARLLQHHHIPYQWPGTPLLGADHPVWSLWVYALWVMTHPWDDAALVRLLRDLYGCSDAQLALYASQLQGQHPSAAGPWLHLASPPVPGQGPAQAVSAALESLFAARLHTQHLPLRRRAQALFEVLSPLRSTLQAPALQPWYSGFLGFISTRLAAGGTSSSVLLQLYRSLREPLPPLGPPSTLTLCTCHQAKGLEWDRVVLPFFYRPIGFAQVSYPRVWSAQQAGGMPYVQTRSGHPLPPVWQHQAQHATCSTHLELERLAYVALTRARQHLLVLDDRLWWSSTKLAGRHPSFGSLLAPQGLGLCGTAGLGVLPPAEA
jgi:superfamily I DNA/RNA helicase